MKGNQKYSLSAPRHLLCRFWSPYFSLSYGYFWGSWYVDIWQLGSSLFYFLHSELWVLCCETSSLALCTGVSFTIKGSNEEGQAIIIIYFTILSCSTNMWVSWEMKLEHLHDKSVETVFMLYLIWNFRSQSRIKVSTGTELLRKFERNRHSWNVAAPVWF